MHPFQTFLAAAVLGVSSLLTLSAQEQSEVRLTQTYASPDCGVRFQYPEKWQVWASHDCTFKVYAEGTQVKRSQAKDNSNLRLVRISVANDTFEDVARDAGFELQNGSWVIKGESEAPAESVHEPYEGLIVPDFACRMYTDNGYAGVGECAAAILADDQRAASFYANPDAIDLLPKLVKSFRFIPTTAATDQQNSPK